MAESTKSHFCTELTAPGKIILFGEHSVVYGKKAIAATLGLYTNARLTEDGSDDITLRFPDIGFEEKFSLAGVREYFKQLDNTNGKEFMESVAETFQDFYAKHGKNSLTPTQRYSVLTFFQCFACFSAPCSGFVLTVKTSLPISSGAGSSASFSVTVTTALCLLYLSKTNKLSDYIQRDEPDKPPTITDKLRDVIIEKAFLCESIFHGSPSGIDHSVITHGSAIEFVKGVRNNSLKPIDGSLLKILLVDTRVPRSSKKQVEILKKLKDKYPETVLNILDAIGNISNEAGELLESLKVEREEVPRLEARLRDLIDLNHGLLRCVGLSHDSLEKVCETAKRRGLSAKLTGAGGGGLAFVFIPRDTPPDVVNNLKDELCQDGFLTYEVVLGGPGLKIESLSP